MRTLEVCLLGVLVCAAQAQAAGEAGQIWFGARAAGSGNPRYASTDVTEANTTLGNSQFLFPTSGRLSNLKVECAGAPGGSAYWEVQSNFDGNTGTLYCKMSSGDTTCEDPTNADDFKGADDLHPQLVTFSITTTGTATAADCVIGVRVTGYQDDMMAPHDPLITFGDATPTSPSFSPRYGAPSITAATQRLNQATEGAAGIVVPVGGLTFSQLCVRLSSPMGSSRTETFQLRNSRAGQDSDALSLSVTGITPDQQKCKAITQALGDAVVHPNAGDLLTVQFSHTGSAQTRSRMVTLEYSGGGGWIGSGAPWTNGSTKYFTMQEGSNTTASALPQRVSQSGVIRHLYAKASGNPPTPPVITLWKGASTTATPQMTPQALSVTVPTTPTPVVVSDTTHEILVRQGDFITTEIKTAGSTSGTTMWGYELVPNGNRYAVALGSGTNDWSDNTHWSVSSGGSGGTSKPTVLDDCYLDANSLSSPPPTPPATRTFTVDTDGACKNLDTTGIGSSGTLVIKTGHSLTVNGDASFGSQTVDNNGAAIFNGNVSLGTASTMNIHNESGASWSSTGANFTFASGMQLTNEGSMGTGDLSFASGTTCSNSGALEAGDFTVEGGATFTNDAGVLSADTLEVQSGATFNNDVGALTLGGLTLASGTFPKATGTIAINGSLTTGGNSLGALSSSAAVTMGDDVEASSWVLSGHAHNYGDVFHPTGSSPMLRQLRVAHGAFLPVWSVGGLGHRA